MNKEGQIFVARSPRSMSSLLIHLSHSVVAEMRGHTNGPFTLFHNCYTVRAKNICPEQTSPLDSVTDSLERVFDHIYIVHIIIIG